MNRVEKLNEYLKTLNGLNRDNNLEIEIQETIKEIRMELGIGEQRTLAAYSTQELHEELTKREGIKEFLVDPYQEAVLEVVTGEVPINYSVEGPVRILVNQD